VEVDAGGNTRIDQARVGAFNNVQYRVWAEFDISPLSGKEIANIGLRAYNDWQGEYLNLYITHTYGLPKHFRALQARLGHQY